MSQDSWESLRQVVKSAMPSGFFTDPTRSFNDFKFDPLWSNQFIFGSPRTPQGILDSPEKNPVLWANVNGWVIPVCGTQVAAEGDLSNVVKLYPAPQTDTRIDLVFLEAWQCRVDANPSTANKPSADKIYKYGNVLYGGTNLDDDLEDPNIRFETTARVQVQYRIRVFGYGAGAGGSATLSVYPDGLGDPNILGQGTATLPVGGFVYSNMRRELGDPSLWRAGDGNPNNALGTVDGYTYAIPICAVFRRASQPYLAVNSAGNPTQNGAFERTPGIKFLANPLLGDRALLQATLTNFLADDVALPATVSVTNLNGCGLEDTSHVFASTFLVIDDEIVGISAVDLIGGTITIPVGGRGRYGTQASGHQAGTAINFWNSRADGLYADQIAATDILDLRQSVNANDWDFDRLLAHNVAALSKGELRSTWKKSDTGDTIGTVVHEVDYLYQAGAVPNQTLDIDGLDGVRMIWSDAAVPQFDVTHLLDNDAVQDPQQIVGYTNDTFDATVQWDTAPGFFPSGFMNVASNGIPATLNSWKNGSCLFLFSGGTTGSEGARAGFKGNKESVRFLMPYEYWKTGYPIVEPTNGNQFPWTLRFLDQRGLEPAPTQDDFATTSDYDHHVGPMYPWRDLNFEYPFLVLGGLLRSNLRFTAIPVANLSNPGTQHEIDLAGPDFDLAGDFYSLDSTGDIADDPTAITSPLLHDRRTLFGMLTDGGRDRTGASSQVYVVLYGDTQNRKNNGAFRVVGAGTVGYTTTSAANNTSIVVEPINADFNSGFTFETAVGDPLFVEFRSQEHNSEDISLFGAVPPVPDAVVVLTDIGGSYNHPWAKANLGFGSGYDLSIPLDPADDPPATLPYVESKAIVSAALLYHPGRGGEARVPDDLVRFARVGSRGIGAYLRQSPAEIDTTFPAFTGAPDNEAFYDPVHVQTWNRLPALGWNAPEATNYGGNVVGYTEQDREHELFFDKGSKTIIFRPFRDRRMTLQAMTFTAVLKPFMGLAGSYMYPTVGISKDCLEVFTGTANTGKKMGFPVPFEWMPRFGRQDIPVYQDTEAGAGPFLSGVNHLFRDVADNLDPVFKIIGGDTNLGAPGVTSGFFSTANLVGPVTADYGRSYVAPVPAAMHYIGARKTTDLTAVTNPPYSQQVIDKLNAVTSFDLGHGLKGIQLPPCYGISRLYGVYDVRDFIAHGGLTFKADRITPEPNTAPNLLRMDADQQTLFILQDGAVDYCTPAGDPTAELGYHTYIVPSNAIDITRADNYVPGDEFEDYHYIIECSFFGFARNWINENNFVLVRHFDGSGAATVDGDDPQIEGLHMILPCAAALNDQAYSAYNRTVYQGDAYQSRRPGAMTVSDYEVRYGQVPITGQYLLETPIQQFNASGVFMPEIPNPKSFEVLSSMDFYTTLGTGKIGGELVPGTMLDVGYTQDIPEAALRHPSADDQTPWRILPRAFTEGQKESDNRASLALTLLDNTNLNPQEGENSTLRITLLDGTVKVLYGCLLDPAFRLVLTAGMGIPVQDIFTVDPSTKAMALTFTSASVALNVQPGDRASWNVTVTGAAVGDSVVLNPPQPHPNLSTEYMTYDGLVTAPDTVTVTVRNTWPFLPLKMLPSAAPAMPLNMRTPFSSVTTAGAPGIAVGAGLSALVYTWTVFGADPAKDQVVVVQENTPAQGDALTFNGYVTAANTVEVYAHNATAAPITVTSRNLDLILLEKEVADDHKITSLQPVYGTVLHAVGDTILTVQNLVTCINNNTDLTRTLTASSTNTGQVVLTAVPTGTEGNRITVSAAQWTWPGPVPPAVIPTATIQSAIRFDVPRNNARRVGAQVTSSPLLGGVDFPFNAGNGTSPLKLTGMTERLPLGALLQDSDFLCENPLNDTASAMRALPAGPRPIQTLMPLTEGGNEYSRFFGEPGELLTLADGTPNAGDYIPYTSATPLGTRKFRLYRGGGSAFVLSGNAPGGPIDWVTEVFPKTSQPALKGGMLACRAMLVRNFYEEVSAGPRRVTDGDEIQMVILTYGKLGDGNTQNEGITLNNIISPSGYGEGYAAADRYRIAGRPMFRGFSREVPDPTDVTLTVYPVTQR